MIIHINSPVCVSIASVYVTYQTRSLLVSPVRTNGPATTDPRTFTPSNQCATSQPDPAF